MLDEGVEALDALGAFVDRWLSAVDSAKVCVKDCSSSGVMDGTAN